MLLIPQNIHFKINHLRQINLLIKLDISCRKIRGSILMWCRFKYIFSQFTEEQYVNLNLLIYAFEK